MIGDMASDLGKVPLNIKNKDYGKVAMALGMPLGVGALGGLGGAKTKAQFLNEVLNPVAGLSSPIKGLLKKSNINAQEAQALINYLKKGQGFKKNVLRTPEMDEATAAYREDIADLLSEEGQKRLKKIGIDVEDFNKNLPELFFQDERGSYSIGTHPSVTERPGVYINPETNKGVMKKYDMTQGDIVSHEIGHTLQTAVDRNSPKFKDKLAFYKQHEKDIKEYPNWGWWKKMIYDEPYPIQKYEHFAMASPTSTLIDEAAGNLIPKETLKDAGLENLAYFNKGQGATLLGLLSGKRDINERLPFLREMRNSMKSKGYIKNIYDEIPESMISKYLKEKPKNRISSAFEDSKENRKLLANLFKVLPSAGAGVATTLSLANQKDK
jgi:hypothetical protein